MQKSGVLFLLFIAFQAYTATLTAQPMCKEEALVQSKAEFRRLWDIRRQNPAKVSNQEFRAASNRYIFEAERCYEAKYGIVVPTEQKIDYGGLWVSDIGQGGNQSRALLAEPGSSYPQYLLFGTKWGAGSPFTGGQDVTGPRSQGGAVTYSFMANAVPMAAEAPSDNPTDDPNTAIGSLATFDTCFYQEISDAFGAWSAVADVTFTPVTDNGAAYNAAGATGDIRIGAHAIDGASGVIAHAYFPPPNGLSAAGDLHFDKAENWACNPVLGAIDIGIVALHEIGHSIGLRHEGTDPAVMEAFYNPAYTFGPLADDIIGAGEIYGETGAATTAFFGDVGIGTDNPRKQLHIRGSSDAGGSLNDTAIRLVNSSTTRLNRHMLSLVNNGTPQLIFTDTGLGLGNSWQLNPTGDGRFIINKPSSAAIEILVKPGGDMIIGGSLTTDMSVVPDYVFEASYPLMPLGELEAFAKREKHLPNVPSAEEIGKTGKVNMTELQMKLLEKIEELTLYTLQQEDQIRALRDQVADLVKRVVETGHIMAHPGLTPFDDGKAFTWSDRGGKSTP